MYQSAFKEYLGGQPVFESVSREFCSFFWSVDMCTRVFSKNI